MSQFVLVCQRPEGGEARFELHPGGSYRIGSRQDNDIVVDQKDVSRHHAVLRVHDTSFHLTDLKSKNGTFVNGTRIESTSFQCGDLVNLSSVRMVVVDAGSGEQSAVSVFGVGADEPSLGDGSEDTQQFRSAAGVSDLVELLEVCADAIRRGAAAPPLSWGVERLGLDGAAVLYRDRHGGVAMVTSAGDLGPLVNRSESITRLVVERVARAGRGPVIQEVEDLGERLLLAPLDGAHVLVVRFTGSPPSINDIRALVAAQAMVVGVVRSEGVTTPSGPAAAAPRSSSEAVVIGASRVIAEVRQAVHAASGTGQPLLVIGERGVGKALAAHAVHLQSSRSAGPFISLAWEGDTVPDEGTWARQVEHAAAAAQGGTLLVRRVDRLPPNHLERTLRVTEMSGVRLAMSAAAIPGGVGGDRLYGSWFTSYGVTAIEIPPLRERRGDIPLLAAHFAATSGGGRGQRAFTPQALAALTAYDWPGNVSQLRREIRRLTDAADGDRVWDVVDLSAEVADRGGSNVGVFDCNVLAEDGLAAARETFERWLIGRVIAGCGGNQTDAARVLGLSRAGLFKKVRRLGLET